MALITSILVAIDESESSKSALSVATELARKAGARLKGLYVEDIARLLQWEPVALMGAALGASTALPKPLPTEEQIKVENEFIEERNKIQKYFDHACSNSELTDITFFTKRGRIDEEIIEASKMVDLVVIGERGKPYPGKLQEPSSTTENIVRSCVKPVIVVPEKAKRTTRILIGYDGSKAAQRALSNGAVFASIQSSEVEVLCVNGDTKKAEKHLNDASEFLISHGIEAKYIKSSQAKNPWQATIDHAINFNAGLIIIGAFGDNKFKELIFGSTTHNVLVHTPCPVLLSR